MKPIYLPLLVRWVDKWNFTTTSILTPAPQEYWVVSVSRFQLYPKFGWTEVTSKDDKS